MKYRGIILASNIKSMAIAENGVDMAVKPSYFSGMKTRRISFNRAVVLAEKILAKEHEYAGLEGRFRTVGPFACLDGLYARKNNGLEKISADEFSLLVESRASETRPAMRALAPLAALIAVAYDAAVNDYAVIDAILRKLSSMDANLPGFGLKMPEFGFIERIGNALPEISAYNALGAAMAAAAVGIAVGTVYQIFRFMEIVSAKNEIIKNAKRQAQTP